MARYYFDLYDGRHLIRDEFGTECHNPDEIKTEAMTALPAIARDIVPREGDRQALMILARNANNITVFTATLTYSGIWLGEGSLPMPEDDDLGENVHLI